MKAPLCFSDADCEFTLGFSEKIQVTEGGEYPFYEGEYVVTPSVDEQVLNTAKKSLDEDIRVKKIPYFEVSNNSGGTTVTIGNEV